MKKRIFVIMLLLGSFTLSANAQLLQFGLKVQYSTETVDQMVNTVTDNSTYQNFSTDFLKNCEGGLLARINVGRFITIQPEANFSIGAVWDSVDAQGDFISAVTYAVGEAERINLSVPILAAAHLLDVDKMIDFRIFAGPEFYGTIKGAQEEGIDFSKFSIVAGIGIDLLDVIYVDARVTKMLDGDQNMFYRLGVGLLF